MTQAKAKLYKTARIAEAVFGYNVGDCVAVRFVGRGAFELNFQINAPASDECALCVPEHYLTDFVL